MKELTGISVIVTSFKEEQIIGRCVKSLVESLPNNIQNEIIVSAPDTPTLIAAENTLKEINYKSYKLVQDAGIGKWNGLNEAVKASKYDLLVFTDGDVYVDKASIEKLLALFDENTAAVGGHPIPTNNRSSMYGFYSHLFCEAANKRRLQLKTYTPLSGYLMAVKKVPKLFPLPENLKAEDAYISAWLFQNGYKISYQKDALVYVLFPNNQKDWLDQKVRSLGGNIQLKKFTAYLPHNKRRAERSVLEDLSMVFFPISYAKSIKELVYALYLYVLRGYLWIKIYAKHVLNKYESGAWKQIKSTKLQ